MTPYKSITLEAASRSGKKFYTVDINRNAAGCTVDFRYGAVGGAVKAGTKTPAPVPLEAAEAIYDELVTSKVNGDSQYVPVNAPSASYERPALAATNAEPVKCLPPRLLNDIDPERVLEYTGDDYWWAQLKHDGDRVQLHVNGLQTILFSGRSAKLRACPSVIATSVAALPNYLVIDGELVGETLYAFDLLLASSAQAGLVDLRELEYEIRYAGLRTVVQEINCPAIVLVETARTRQEKASLIVRAKKAVAEGIVFVNKNAAYKAGRPNVGGDNLRWKFRESASLIVAEHHPSKNSLDVMLFDGTRIGSVTMIGKVRPPVGTVVEIEYLYCYTALVQATYKGVRTDVKPEACTRAQIKFRDGIDPVKKVN